MLAEVYYFSYKLYIEHSTIIIIGIICINYNVCIIQYELLYIMYYDKITSTHDHWHYYMYTHIHMSQNRELNGNYPYYY